MSAELTEDMAEFIGILLGDGGINKGLKNVVVHNGTEDYFYMNNYVRLMIKKLFSLDVKVIDRKRRNEILIRISSTKVFGLLTKDYGLWSGPKQNIGIPEIIKTASQENRFAFLRGLADSDFSFMFKKGGKYPIVRANFKSKNLIIDLKSMFLELGFTCFIETDKERSYKTRSWITNVITLSGQKNLSKWFSYIGSSNPKHYTKFLIWKLTGECQPYTNLKQRLKVLKRVGATGFEFANYGDFLNNFPRPSA